MNDILSFIGLAKKAGHLEIGEEPVAAAARAPAARRVLIPSAPPHNTRRRAKRFQDAGNAVLFRLPFTKEELGDVTDAAPARFWR